jgi:nicotinamidase-related amidase
MRQSEQGSFTRIRPFDAARTCLLLVDVQNYTWNPDIARTQPYFDAQVREVVLPNLGRLIGAFREAGGEVMYTVIENLTKDGRDRSLDYKICDFFVAKGSREARVLEAVAPGEDEIVLPKTSSGVFNSTNIEYLLRNIGIDTLVVTGFLTDQCVDMAVRDAADRGYLVTLVEDACATYTEQRHLACLNAIKGYCWITDTDTVLGRLQEMQP